MSTEAYKRQRVTKHGIIKRINVVKDFIFMPCDASVGVYVETAIEPLGELIMTWLSFGMDDVVRGYARPKSLRGQKRYRPKKQKTARKGGKVVRAEIPELGEEIGKVLPGAEEFRKRTVSTGVKNLWVVDGLIQRGLWYWLVVDSVTEFSYEWSSAIIKTACTPTEQQKARVLSYGEQSTNILYFQDTPLGWSGWKKNVGFVLLNNALWSTNPAGINLVAAMIPQLSCNRDNQKFLFKIKYRESGSAPLKVWREEEITLDGFGSSFTIDGSFYGKASDVFITLRSLMNRNIPVLNKGVALIKQY